MRADDFMAKLARVQERAPLKPDDTPLIINRAKLTAHDRDAYVRTLADIRELAEVR